MKRAIKFKLKNGKVVTIRCLVATDYDAHMKFMEKFTRGPGAVQTMQYRGQPKKDKEITIMHYEKNFVVGAFDGDNMIGIASVTPQRVGHPYSGRSTGVGMMMLDKYTGNGLGSKFFQILEKWARENGIHKLVGDVRHLNIPSIAACIKNSFITMIGNGINMQPNINTSLWPKKNDILFVQNSRSICIADTYFCSGIMAR